MHGRPAGGEDRLEAEGLHEILVNPDRLGAAEVALAIGAGGGYNEGTAERSLRAEPLGDLEAVHHRLADVEDHGLGTEPERRLDCGGPILCHRHIVAPGAKEKSQARGGLAVVVDDQHTQGGMSGRSPHVPTLGQESIGA